MIALDGRYPLLRDRVPRVSLAELPTSVQRLEQLGRLLGADHLYIKRDDLSGAVYGGNKPRKLEFILGEALHSGAREVLTFGCAGSNHALATAICGQQVGLKCISILMPQPNAHYVRRNLLLGHHYGAEMHLSGGELASAWSKPQVYLSTLGQVMRHTLITGSMPRVIPPGGSSPLGVVGYVNAALELAQQVAEGEMPEPDVIYVACGTMGTAAGLVLGLKAAGLGCRVVPVQVTSGQYANAEGLAKLVNRTSVFLHSLDDSFPALELSSSDVDIRGGYLGRCYAQFTDEGMEAVSLMQECEGIALEGTYTGKALAALVADVRSGRLAGRTILFWNTVNSRDFSDVVKSIDYHDLPRAFHRYFEDDVQPLDR